MSAASEEFVREMLDENELPDRNWHNFDPPFARATVAAFERRGWIETKDTGRYAEHRWTLLGQAEQLAAHLRGLGYRVERPHGLVGKLRATSPTSSAPLHGEK